MAMLITILGIESSCDDTSAAVIRDGYLLSNVIAGQDVHKSYGGVVPELASRSHLANIIPVVDQAIKQACIKKEEISVVASIYAEAFNKADIGEKWIQEKAEEFMNWWFDIQSDLFFVAIHKNQLIGGIVG